MSNCFNSGKVTEILDQLIPFPCALSLKGVIQIIFEKLFEIPI